MAASYDSSTCILPEREGEREGERERVHELSKTYYPPALYVARRAR